MYVYLCIKQTIFRFQYILSTKTVTSSSYVWMNVQKQLNSRAQTWVQMLHYCISLQQYLHSWSAALVRQCHSLHDTVTSAWLSHRGVHRCSPQPLDIDLHFSVHLTGALSPGSGLSLTQTLCANNWNSLLPSELNPAAPACQINLSAVFTAPWGRWQLLGRYMTRGSKVQSTCD